MIAAEADWRKNGKKYEISKLGIIIAKLLYLPAVEPAGTHP